MYMAISPLYSPVWTCVLMPIIILLSGHGLMFQSVSYLILYVYIDQEGVGSTGLGVILQKLSLHSPLSLYTHHSIK